ncbi:MAG: hypothetical protein IKQ54_02960, partial [Oscillospiraceae bacterium]|nr:hypothetical protein [Oscillospiraceae bacterium]
MGKYEKKKHSDFHDIQNVFAKRDQNRAARQEGQGAQNPQDYPEVPEFMNEPRRIRGDAGYSVDNMRQVHEGRAVYEETPQYRESSSVHSQAQPVYVQEPYEQQSLRRAVPRRRRRKRGFLRTLLRVLALLLVLLILGGVVSALFAKMPET